MFTIKRCTKIKEGGAYETGYEISNSDGKMLFEFAPEYLKDYYEELNIKEEEDAMKLDEKLTNIAADIIDIFEELLDRLDITIPDKWRVNEEDEARIFGDTYFELENKIVERLKKEKN